ncbi:MAG: electron transport complex subunit RsxC [Candidatus Symbiodolus clandestinus]
MILPTITLREQSAIRPLATGICPAEHKACSTQQPIQRLSLPDRLIIPLQQHAGPAGQLRVVVGQSVAKGEPLTQGIDPYAVPVHASAAGWISAIRPYHPPLQSQKLQLPPPLCVELTVNHQPLKQPSHGFYTPWINYCQRPLEHLRQRAHAAGLAGLGGAGFPSSAKWPKLPVQLLIINAVECEPYITADDSLLREQATAVIQGCHILQHILQAQQTVLAIEENKPQAFAALQQAFTNSVLAGNWLQFRQLPTRYPSGDARQLITLLTGHSVPLGQHSSQLGVVVHNVATLFALQQAVVEGKPLIERVVTVTGEAIQQPRNYWAALGTPVSYLLQQAGLVDPLSVTITVGGPLMGQILNDLQTPVIKTTGCLLLQPATPPPPEQPCIRCGECAYVCPVNLLPQQLYWYSRGQQHAAAQTHHLMSCIECGACNSVCPSNIPLVNYFQQEKAQLRQQAQLVQLANTAKRRFEAKQQRLMQQQQQRQQQRKETVIVTASAYSTRSNTAHHHSSAPLGAHQEVTGSPNKTLTPPSTQVATPAASANLECQAAVAAALARAKARKQQRHLTTHAPCEGEAADVLGQPTTPDF